jgi:HSP20 family molecular chaperone IbpA
VALTNTQLRIVGEKKRVRSRQRNVSHLCSERSYGRFSRTLPLRWTISVKDARAELSKGLLLICLPKIKDRRGGEFRVPIKETEKRK